MSSDILFKPASHWVDFLQRTGCVVDAEGSPFRSTNELCGFTRIVDGTLVIYNVDDQNREMSVSIPFSESVTSGDPHRKHAIDFKGSTPAVRVTADHGVYTVTIGTSFTFKNWDKLVMRVRVA